MNLDKGDYASIMEREKKLQRKSREVGQISDSLTLLLFILQVSYFCSYDIIWDNEIILWSTGSLSGHYQLFINFPRVINNHLFSLFIISISLQHAVQTPFLQSVKKKIKQNKKIIHFLTLYFQFFLLFAISSSIIEFAPIRPPTNFHRDRIPYHNKK